MRCILVALFAIALGGCSLQKVESQQLPRNDNTPTQIMAVRKPVLVELFTSEGCSSCPPAERTIDFLDRTQPFSQAEVIALAFHVDYWNHLGWKDPFSSERFTSRQAWYKRRLNVNQIYTPQMIVDGRTEFVGSNDRRANAAIQEAARMPKADVRVSINGRDVNVIVSEIPAHGKATVFLAITENDLTTAVAGGENAGKELRHRGVVRELKPLGTVDHSVGRVEFTEVVEIDRDWKRENLSLVVFCQEDETGRILGVGRIPFR